MSLVRALLLCGFQPGERFSVAAIRDREIRPACFENPNQAEAFLAQFVGWNHYLCGNPVRPECHGKPRLEDVLEARIMLVDCDPDPDEAEARAAVLRVAGFLQEQTGQYPTVVDSGRGTQAWLLVDLTPEWRRALSGGLARRFAMTGVKFDATHNADRLMRLPGSTNLKTGRVASVIHEGTGAPINCAAVQKMGLPAEPVASPAASGYAVGAPTEADLALLVGGARAAWDEPAEKGERSKRDFRLVLALIRAKATEEQACRLLWAMPGSKAAEDGRGRDYWDATMASVRRHLAEEELLVVRARALPEAAKMDAGAPFEEAALDALLYVRQTDEPDWQRLRVALKSSRVPIRALEQAMDARLRRGDEVPARLRFVADDQRRVGWFKQTREDGWVNVDGSEARATMRAQGQDPDSETKTLTDAPWCLVNAPFAAEELPGRRWNKDGARFGVKPEPGPHPTWDALLAHVGRSLDELVLRDDWCRVAGVLTGGAYLLKWAAAMFQRPKARTAYLFLHGPQEAGKSTFHEALRDLLGRGYVRANHALKSKEGFNGEIANAVLCVVEEVDLSDSRRDTFERVKDWVTGEVISVRALYRQAVDFVNTTHWVQCAQKRSFMPVLPGDTRITELYVDVAESPRSKDEFRAALRTEAPAFLYAALHEPLPEAVGRLFVPALASEGKSEQADAARTELEDWMLTHAWLEVTEEQMVAAFLEWLPPGARGHWDRGRVMRELPPTARRDRRLTQALRGALGGPGLPVSGLLRALPTPAKADWGSSVALGKALRRVAPRLEWLEMVTIQGLDVWRLVGGEVK